MLTNGVYDKAFVIALCAQVMMGAAHTLVLLLGALFCTYLACFHEYAFVAFLMNSAN